MPEPDRDEVERALERLAASQGGAPVPQPKPRVVQQRGEPQKSTKHGQKVEGKVRPAAPTSVEAPKPTSTARPARKQKRPAPGLTIRRTLIPILLTGGFILVALAITALAWQSVDNPLLDFPKSLVWSMCGVGALCWLLALANMYSVHRTLRSH